jgi:hypothetical protein
MNTSTSHLPPEPASPDRPTWTELLNERAAMIGAPAFFGPPISFVLGPWLLLVLLLIGPSALLITGLLFLAVAGILLAALVALIASPYLLIRHLQARYGVHAKPCVQLHPFRKHRVSSGRLDSLQPKGIS